MHDAFVATIDSNIEGKTRKFTSNVFGVLADERRVCTHLDNGDRVNLKIRWAATELAMNIFDWSTNPSQSFLPVEKVLVWPQLCRSIDAKRNYV